MVDSCKTNLTMCQAEVKCHPRSRYRNSHCLVYANSDHDLNMWLHTHCSQIIIIKIWLVQSLMLYYVNWIIFTDFVDEMNKPSMKLVNHVGWRWWCWEPGWGVTQCCRLCLVTTSDQHHLSNTTWTSVPAPVLQCRPVLEHWEQVANVSSPVVSIKSHVLVLTLLRSSLSSSRNILITEIQWTINRKEEIDSRGRLNQGYIGHHEWSTADHLHCSCQHSCHQILWDTHSWKYISCLINKILTRGQERWETYSSNQRLSECDSEQWADECQD